MRSVAIFTALLLVLSGAGPAVAAPNPVADGSGPDGAAALRASTDGVRAQTDSSFDRSPKTVMRVELRADRSAEWRVEVTYDLDGENETRAFEQVGREYENGESDVGVDADLFRQIASQASETTGREMEIQNATYDYSTGDGTGTLSMSFVWTNFLKEGDGDNLRLGDVFLVPSDQSESSPTWLSLMGDNQRMVIQPPDGYTTNTTSIRVKQQNNAIILDGPSEFNDDDRLVVTYRRNDIRQTFQWPLYLGGGALVLVALALGAAVVLRGRRDGAGAPASTAGGSPPESPTAAANGGTPAEGAASVGDRSNEGPNAVAGPNEPDDGTAETGEDDEDEVDLSLLSDEERVEHLLERNGGRMKQANIVKETGWSDAKVSQLLSAMADDGRVTKLRLGRENLISLPDEDDAEDAAN